MSRIKLHLQRIKKQTGSEYERLFTEFLAGEGTLQVYDADKLVFASRQDRLVPLVEYIDTAARDHHDVVIFDRITGRAAALLCVLANCREIYSPLGSQLAIDVLEEYRVKHHLSRVVPCIQKADQQDMCPMEKLSLGKKPEEFYHLIKTLLAKSRG